MCVRVVGYGKMEKQQAVCRRDAADLPYFGLVHLVEGNGFFWSEHSGELDLSAGDTILLMPGVAHSYGSRPGQIWREFWILFDSSFVGEYMENGLLCPDSSVLRNSFPEEWSIMSTFGQSPADSARRSALAIALYGLSVDSAIERGGNQMLEVVESITCAMSKCVSDTVFDFESAARSLGYSPVHMRRLFKTAMGRTPVCHFNYLKVEEVKRQLTYTSKTAQAIARELGWKDDAYFRRVFTSFEGISPSHWRKKFRASVIRKL
ncbi:MAG: helix-turn-helix domain-containing protein [Armatimonadota bacterium]